MIVIDAIKEALWEFQAGTRKTKSAKALKAAQIKKRPKWMDLRERRLPVKKEKKIKREVKLKRDVTKLRRPLPAVTPAKMRMIKRERAIYNTREPEEEKRLDSGLNDSIDAPRSGSSGFTAPPLTKR